MSQREKRLCQLMYDYNYQYCNGTLIKRAVRFSRVLPITFKSVVQAAEWLVPIIHDDNYTRGGCMMFNDCRGDEHSTESDRNAADVTIVTKILEEGEKWVCEYQTENTDHPNGYSYLAREDDRLWEGRVDDWLCEQEGDFRARIKDLVAAGGIGIDLDDINETLTEDEQFDDIDDWVDYVIPHKVSEEIAQAICERITDWDAEYDSYTWGNYEGPGVCLYSLELGETEEQIEIVNYPELKALHDEGRLDDILDDVNCDVSIYRCKKRVRNEETGNYEEVGRETYNHYNHPATCLTACLDVPGQWHYVVCDDHLNEAYDNYLIDYVDETLAAL